MPMFTKIFPHIFQKFVNTNVIIDVELGRRGGGDTLLNRNSYIYNLYRLNNTVDRKISHR